MTMNRSGEQELRATTASHTPRVLVLGGGLPAQVAAQALAEMGVAVTFARLVNTPFHTYSASKVSGVEDTLDSLSPGNGGIELLDVEGQIPVISRDREGFKALFPDESESLYDCIVLAPGIALIPQPAVLPQDAELFTSRNEFHPPEKLVFLMDYERPSDPALGMAAICAATDNVLNGGESVVCFRNVPVPHLLGETIYDAARKGGVQFVRFGENPPRVSSRTNQDGQIRFRLSAPDMIDEGRDFVFDCDRVLSVTGPDPWSVPAWARQLVRCNLDHHGFILPDSVHCNSGCSFASGVFVIGEATGNLDLLNAISQAKAAAVKVLAWVKASRIKKENPPTSVSDACVGCLTCHRVCPHEAVLVKPGMQRVPIEHSALLCRGCGICASVCPAVAINLAACPEDALVIAGPQLPQKESEPTFLVFACQRSAGLLAQAVQIPDNVQIRSVPCAGRVSEHVIWSSLAAGVKGVLVVGCHEGNCASRTGADWAAARIRRGLSTGLFAEGLPRLAYATVASNEPARFQRLLREFTDELAPESEKNTEL